MLSECSFAFLHFDPSPSKFNKSCSDDSTNSCQYKTGMMISMVRGVITMSHSRAIHTNSLKSVQPLKVTLPT